MDTAYVANGKTRDSRGSSGLIHFGFVINFPRCSGLTSKKMVSNSMMKRISHLPNHKTLSHMTIRMTSYHIQVHPSKYFAKTHLHLIRCEHFAKFCLHWTISHSSTAEINKSLSTVDGSYILHSIHYGISVAVNVMAFNTEIRTQIQIQFMFGNTREM